MTSPTTYVKQQEILLAKKKPNLATRFKQAVERLKINSVLRIEKFLRWLLIATMLAFALLLGLVFLYSSNNINPVSTLMAGRFVTFQAMERKWVSYGNINPVLVHSVMMSEDARFCEHNGVDWEALNDVIDNALDGERTRGASTLSMQVVKNLFLWPGRSYIRKALEVPLALVADRVWSKTRMIEIYLNIAEWDEGVFGIEAAAQHYFNRKAANLSARQSALLAVTLPNPVSRNPTKPSRGLSKLAKRIQKRAYQSGAYVKCVH